jgi:hypothetical protein
MPGIEKGEPLVFVLLSYYLIYFGDRELLFTVEDAESRRGRKKTSCFALRFSASSAVKNVR